MGHGGISHSVEMVEAVLGVADVAWEAMEFGHRRFHQKHNEEENQHADSASSVNVDEEIESLKVENRRLRKVLEENLKILQRLSACPSIYEDCPSDLYKMLEAAVDSKTFLTQLESLHEASLDAPCNKFPFDKATGADINSAEIVVNLGLKEPSLWVWVTHENVSPNVEELSGIDNECYVIVNEDLVVDGVANFMARCILSNPKSKRLSPEELQKTVAKALGGVNKVEKMFNIWHAGQLFYALATWGLCLSGLYRHRAAVRVAAKGIGTTGKILMKSL
ncbi:hypothetical protein IFM89_009801 [Coptis chinensis]|uniref:Uncharacterized protein n=1 Tax=Coptis chinensis TaxID=261450 RepID=A0A835HWV5_9MAGN|nr:hypothetical protein IFM89_009801 [Coptis chinensis]